MYFWDTVSVKEIDVTCHEEHDCIMLKCHILFVGNSIQLLPAKIWVMNTWASVVWLFFSPFSYSPPPPSQNLSLDLYFFTEYKPCPDSFYQVPFLHYITVVFLLFY